MVSNTNVRVAIVKYLASKRGIWLAPIQIHDAIIETIRTGPEDDMPYTKTRPTNYTVSQLAVQQCLKTLYKDGSIERNKNGRTYRVR